MTKEIKYRRLKFLICGAQKSGTTALYKYLEIHPEIFLPKTKELHIFDNEARDWSDSGINSIDEETKHHFNNAPEKSICGEATPVSLFWFPAIERIWRYNPQIKLIAVLRNPITRAYSQWNMEVQKGREEKVFNTCLEAEEERCREALPLQHRVFSYLERGFYSAQIRRLWKYFPREQFLILRQEQLQNEPEEVLKLVHKHLEVKNIDFSSPKSFHKRNYDSLMPFETKVALREVYKNEIAELELMLGWNCSNWING